jgi:hypothetical protein
MMDKALAKTGLNYEMKFRQNGEKQLVVDYVFTDYEHIGLGGLRPQISVINSTDGSRAFNLIGGVFRLVCSNGLVAGDIFDSERIVHRVGPTFDRKIESLPLRIVALVEDTVEAMKELNELTCQELSENKMIEIVGNLTMSKKAKTETIKDVVFEDQRREDDQGNNVWTLYNIVNENLRKHSKAKAYQKHNEKLLENIQLLAA